MSASAPGRIFFSHEEIAFAAPSPELAALPLGAAVALVAERDRVVGSGELFRVRREHVVIRLREGRARIGDLARPAGGAERPAPDEPVVGAAGNEAARGRDRPPATIEREPATPGAEPQAAAKVILVYQVANAPRLLADRFDSDFIRSLLRETAAAPHLVVRHRPRPRDGRLNAVRIRNEARRAGAALALTPYYSQAADGDSLAVRIHDGATGRRIATVSTPIRLMENLVFLPDGRRLGRLRLVGRYDGIEPPPEELRLDAEGRPVIRIGAEWFVLRDGAARFLGDPRSWPAAEAERAARHRVGREAAPGGLERIVIFEDERRLFASNPIAPGRPLARRDSHVAFFDGRSVRLLSIDPAPAD